MPTFFFSFCFLHHSQVKDKQIDSIFQTVCNNKEETCRGYPPLTSLAQILVVSGQRWPASTYSHQIYFSTAKLFCVLVLTCLFATLCYIIYFQTLIITLYNLRIKHITKVLWFGFVFVFLLLLCFSSFFFIPFLVFFSCSVCVHGMRRGQVFSLLANLKKGHCFCLSVCI